MKSLPHAKDDAHCLRHLLRPLERQSCRELGTRQVGIGGGDSSRFEVEVVQGCCLAERLSSFFLGLKLLDMLTDSCSGALQAQAGTI